jgi:methyl-accepting chemotaxis protein
LSDPTAVAGTARAPKYKRKMSNYLLDKKLQLRYVLVVTILSAIIAGTLGFMIYHQRRIASESIEKDLATLTQSDANNQSFQENVASDLESEDKALVYKMIGAGLGLIVILSLYLIIMTHKVAGPLFKVSIYFERMAEGRLGNVTPLRRGDMLIDFFDNFKTMHEAVRAREVADVAVMEKVAAGLRGGDNRSLTEALDELEKHVDKRKKQIA